MDIVALSMSVSPLKIDQEVSISVMKMAIDAGRTHMNDMMQLIQGDTKMMEQSVNPHRGSNLDIKI